LQERERKQQQQHNEQKPEQQQTEAKRRRADTKAYEVKKPQVMLLQLLSPSNICAVC
jgi:hypothetical protein